MIYNHNIIIKIKKNFKNHTVDSIENCVQYNYCLYRYKTIYFYIVKIKSNYITKMNNGTTDELVKIR